MNLRDWLPQMHSAIKYKAIYFYMENIYLKRKKKGGEEEKKETTPLLQQNNEEFCGLVI